MSSVENAELEADQRRLHKEMFHLPTMDNRNRVRPERRGAGPDSVPRPPWTTGGAVPRRPSRVFAILWMHPWMHACMDDACIRASVQPCKHVSMHVQARTAQFGQSNRGPPFDQALTGQTKAPA